MHKIRPETKEALEAERLGLFVFFDFVFSPMRVHSGERTVFWDGHNWKGIGEVLRTGFSSNPPTFSHRHSNRGTLSASLPLDGKTKEIAAKGFYLERTMKIFICALDEQGNVIERVHYNKGTMIKPSFQSGAVNFEAEDDTFDSTEEKDARHKRNAETVRQQFKGEARVWAAIDTLGVLGGLTSLGDFLVGVVVTCIGWLLPKRVRSMLQRGRFQKHVYWFTTTPSIPGLRPLWRGYPIRADTLEEAKAKLYGMASARIWSFPRGWIQMLVYVNGSLLELFDLDAVRKQSDKEKWLKTDPTRQWRGAPS